MLILFSLMQSSKRYWGWWDGGRRKRRMKLLFISRCFFTSQTSSCKGNLVPRQTDCLGGCAYQGHWGIHTFRQKQWLFFTLSNYFLRKRECGRWRRLSEKTSCWPQHLGLGDTRGPLRTQPIPANALTLASHFLQLAGTIRHILFICLSSELCSLELPEVSFLKDCGVHYERG